MKSTLILLIEEKLHRDRNGLQPSKLESCNFLPGNIPEYSTEKTGSREANASYENGSLRLFPIGIVASTGDCLTFLYVSHEIYYRNTLNITADIYFADSRIITKIELNPSANIE